MVMRKILTVRALASTLLPDKLLPRKLLPRKLLPGTLLLVTLLLGACGFHLRGESTLHLPFKTLYIQSANLHTPFVAELKRAVEAAGADVVDSPEAAQLTLHIVTEKMDKKILSLSGAGRVREYQLNFTISFRADDAAQQERIAPAELVLQRIFSYDDEQVLAKEREELLLQENLRSDAVQQLLRRLNRAGPTQILQ